VTDANGKMTSRLTTYLGGTKKVTARVGTTTILQQASVTFTSLPPNAITSTVTASPSSNVAANGIATSTITVTLKDGNHEPVVDGLVVTLTVSGTGNTVSTPALTDTNGQTTATLTSTNTGTKTITASAGGVTLNAQPTVTFVAGPASAYKIAASTATPAPGAGDQLTLTLVDAGGNAVTGFSGDKTLTFSGLAIAADGTYPTVTGKNGLAVNLGTTQAITFASGVSSSASGAAVLRAYSAQTATLNVSDSGGLSSTSPGGAGVSLTLTNVNPVAQAFSVYRAPGLSLKMLKTDLLAGATDANHDTLTVSAVQSQSTQGATLMVAGAYVYYLPNSAGSGDTFTYTVSDGNGGTNTKTVTVYVAQQGGAAQQISYGAGGVTINFAGIPGYSYDVQRSSDAGFSAPTVMTTTQAPSAGVFIYIDSNPPNPGPSFYRLIQH
jgi:adhesin/invasin